MRRLLLTSDFNFSVQDGLRLLFKDVSKIKLAYITTAAKGSNNKTYIDLHKEMMRGERISFNELDIEGKNEAELRELFKGNDAVYVEGGNTFYLLKAVRESGFGVVIKELIEKGVPYIGSSAGSYITCPTIEMATWTKQRERFGVVNLDALNIVPFLIKAHYVPEMKDILKGKIDNAKYETRILKDGQAILVEGDSYKLVGNNGEDFIKINDWLELFKKFWMNKDVEKVIALFSGDVEYFETPEIKFKHVDEIKLAWKAIKMQNEIKLELNLVGYIDGIYDVKWELAYSKQGKSHRYKGVYKIHLNEDKKCNYFMQIEK